MPPRRYRTLSDALANQADEPPAKWAKWARESQRKSDESGESYDGPVVNIREYQASSFETGGRSTILVPVDPPSTEKMQAWKECQNEARDLAVENSIDYTAIGIFGRYLRDSKDKPPLLVIAVSSNEQKEAWKPFIFSIYRMLHAKNCLEIGVEIMAPDLRPEIHYFSVNAGDPLIELWPNLREPFERILGSIEWNVLGILRVGEQKSSAVNTVIIGTKDVTDPEWPSIEVTIKGYLAGIGVTLDTMVLYSQQEQFTVSSPDDNTPSGTPRRRLYKANVQIGQSIGIEKKDSGTLGGYVKLVHPGGHSEVLGMSNYHVVRPSHETVMQAQHEIKNNAWDADHDNGIKHLSKFSPYSIVHSPSISDHKEQYGDIHHCIDESDKELASNAHWKAAVDADWCAVHRILLAELDNTVNRKSTAKGKEASRDVIEWIDAHSNGIDYGTVKYTSGHRTTTPTAERRRSRLDWALIEPINGQRVGNNYLPTSMMPGGRKFADKTRISGFASDDSLQMGPNRLLLKTGRSSGLTFGEYSRIDPLEKFEFPPNSDHPNGGVKTTTYGHTIVAYRHTDKKPLKGYPEPVIPFSKAGDSGSWIIDQQGQLVGMIFGDCPGVFSYFITIETLLADIKLQTGCERVELI